MMQHPSAPHRQYKSMVADITVEEREAELLTDPGVKGFKGVGGDSGSMSS